MIGLSGLKRYLRAMVPQWLKRLYSLLALLASLGAFTLHAAAPVDHAIAPPADDPWVRWTQGGGYLYGVVDALGPVELTCRADAVARDSTWSKAHPGNASSGSGPHLPDIPALVSRRRLTTSQLCR